MVRFLPKVGGSQARPSCLGPYLASYSKKARYRPKTWSLITLYCKVQVFARKSHSLDKMASFSTIHHYYYNKTVYHVLLLLSRDLGIIYYIIIIVLSYVI